ncbi:MAG: hypothetical protein CMH57_08245 [Myxococcales bacterium]|nr:hypothetical protein [Myxococcales bacterium]
MAEAALIVETLDHHDEALAALKRGGYSDSQHHDAESLVEEVSGHVARITGELQHNKTVIHLMHTAATELEIWLQTARFRAGKVVDGDELDTLLGADIHLDNHTVAVLAQAARFIGRVRQDAALREQLCSSRSVQDLLQRGNALRGKLLRLAEGVIRPERDEDLEQAEAWLAPARQKLSAWLGAFRPTAVSALEGQPELLGLLGQTSEGAAPLGGTAANVTLHAKAQRAKAPGAQPAPRAPGWSIGRDGGRNKLNVGNGFT